MSAVSVGIPAQRPNEALEDAGQFFEIWNLLKPPRHLNEAAVRALCRNAYLGDDWSVCRVLGRYRIFVDTKDVGLSTFLLLDGYWEMWTTEAMLQFVRPGMTALDIGANLGYFTMLMADLAGPSGRVLAFEPVPRMAERLRQSVHVNGFAGTTHVHELALGDAPGEIDMFVPQLEPKNAHFSPAEGRPGEVRVPIARADQIEGALDADFIKIDVEGAEEGVWRGLEGILRRGRALTIFLEFTPARYANAAAFLSTILAENFALHRIDYTAGVVPVSLETVLGAPPHEDQMLVLIR